MKYFQIREILHKFKKNSISHPFFLTGSHLRSFSKTSQPEENKQNSLTKDLLEKEQISLKKIPKLLWDKGKLEIQLAATGTFVTAAGYYALSYPDVNTLLTTLNLIVIRDAISAGIKGGFALASLNRLVLYYIQENQKLKLQTKIGMNRIIMAAKYNDYQFLDSINDYREYQSELNTPSASDNNDTALHFAARHGNTYIFRRLLQSGAYLDAINDCGCTPFYEVASGGHVEMLDIIATVITSEDIEISKVINRRTRDGWTPLMAATRYRHNGTAYKLLLLGADSISPNSQGESPLMWALINNNLPLFRTLLKHYRTLLDVNESISKGSIKEKPKFILVLDGYVKRIFPRKTNLQEGELTLILEKNDKKQEIVLGNTKEILIKESGCYYIFEYVIDRFVKHPVILEFSNLNDNGKDSEIPIFTGVSLLDYANNIKKGLDNTIITFEPGEVSTQKKIRGKIMSINTEQLERILLPEQYLSNNLFLLICRYGNVMLFRSLHAALYSLSHVISRTTSSEQKEKRLRIFNEKIAAHINTQATKLRHYRTPLHDACSSADVELVRALIEFDFLNLEQKTISGRIPLELAFKYMNNYQRFGESCERSIAYKKIHELLKNQYRKKIASLEHMTAQEKAIHYSSMGETMLFLQLVEQQKLLNNFSSETEVKQSFLTTAVRFNSPEILEKIVVWMKENQEKVTQDTLDRALYDACYYSANKIVPILLEMGANITYTNEKNGWTCLMLVAWSANLECIRLIFAYLDKNRLDSIEFINKKNNNNQTALYLVCYAAPRYISTKQGDIALNQEIQSIIEYLIIRGSHPNEMGGTRGNKSPLHLLVRSGREDLVTILIKAGANVDIVNEATFSPLHYAAFCDQLNCVRILIQYGANPFSRTKDGKLPIDLANKRNGDAIKALLNEAMLKKRGRLDSMSGYSTVGIFANKKEKNLDNPQKIYSVRKLPI